MLTCRAQKIDHSAVQLGSNKLQTNGHTHTIFPGGKREFISKERNMITSLQLLTIEEKCAILFFYNLFNKAQLRVVKLERQLCQNLPCCEMNLMFFCNCIL